MYALYVAPMGAGSDMKPVVNGLVTELQNTGLKSPHSNRLAKALRLKKPRNYSPLATATN